MKTKLPTSGGMETRIGQLRFEGGYPSNETIDKLYFGPKPPEDLEKNWIPTVPGRGWFAYFRLYAPTEAFFDRSWALPDLVRVK